MVHLTETEFVDLLDGRLPPARAAHLDTCSACAAREAAVRALAEETRDVRLPEPSPLYWQHMAARIEERIAAEPRPSRWSWPGVLQRPAWAWSLGGVLATIVVVAFLSRGPLGRVAAPQVADDRPGQAASQLDAGRDAWVDDIEADEAWALVRTVADDVGWDEAKAGIGVRPQAADHVVLQLSTEERAELARLLEEELRHSGA